MAVLSWIGKEKVVNHHLEVAVRELKRAYSFGVSGQSETDNGSENKIIHGDSLLALKALLPQYEGKVKCAYLDPPYNTGNEGWVYNDNVNDPRIAKWLGEVVGKEGEDFTWHDKWLCMMYPRLKLVQKLLAEDGAVFISIDDNEQAHLKLVCDEIFGASNFAATFVWQKRYSRENREAIGDSHEYVLCYVGNLERFKETRNLLPITEKQRRIFKNPDDDPRGPWQSISMLAQGFRPNQMYEIIAPNGTVHRPPEGNCWRHIQPEFDKLVAADRIYFGPDGNGVPRKKSFLSDAKGLVPWTWLPHEDVGHTDEAKKEQKVIFDGHIPFDTPKPVRLIETLLFIATDPNAIVLDCFAGSATTAHAVLNLNKKDGGHRKFILVELMDYADSLTADRVKRVIKGYGEGKNAVEGTGGDFSFYEIGEPILVGDEPNAAADEESVKDYVWFTETRTKRTRSDGEKNLLGVNFGTAYYYWHNAEEPVVLNRKLLHTIKTKAESYVIYADMCALGEAELEKFHITFKKVSRDIVKI